MNGGFFKVRERLLISEENSSILLYSVCLTGVTGFHPAQLVFDHSVCGLLTVLMEQLQSKRTHLQTS